jgi:hypothetical protein
MKDAICDFTNEQRYAQAVGLQLDPGGSRLAHEQIYLWGANDDRLSQAQFDIPLTDFAVGGWDRTDLAAELAAAFPEVSVTRKFTYRLFPNVEAFASDGDEDRVSILGDFKQVEETNTQVHGVTINRGLMMMINTDEIDTSQPNWEQVRVMRLIRRLQRNSLRRGYALISAAATNTARTWDTSGGKDPDADVVTSLTTGADTSGLRANTAVYGRTAWDKRFLSLRAQNTPAGYSSAAMTPDQLGGVLSARVIQSESRYQSSASAKSQIVGNLVLSYYADGQSTEDPSCIKRFMSPSTQGGKLGVFRWQLLKKIFIAVEMYELLAMTSTLGVRKETIS